MELEQISNKIVEYHPTKVLVEWSYDEQGELDSLYNLYRADEYFTNDSLSGFYLKNEIFQLAFRVANSLNHDRVYGIDYNETEFPFGDVMNDIEKNNHHELKAKFEDAISKLTKEFDNKIESGTSLKELTYYQNSVSMRELSNDLHINSMLLAGSTKDLSGPFLTSEWYKRNLYMWSFIQKNTTDTDERIMVLAGSSHAAMFDLFIKENQYWKVKELSEIMN